MLMEADVPPHSLPITGMVSWGDEALVVSATRVLASNREDEAPVLPVVSAPDPAVALEIHEPPRKEPVVVVLGTPESAMLSASWSPTSMGRSEKRVRKSLSKQLDEEPEGTFDLPKGPIPAGWR